MGNDSLTLHGITSVFIDITNLSGVNHMHVLTSKKTHYFCLAWQDICGNCLGRHVWPLILSQLLEQLKMSVTVLCCVLLNFAFHSFKSVLSHVVRMMKPWVCCFHKHAIRWKYVHYFNLSVNLQCLLLIFAWIWSNRAYPMRN